MLSRQAGRGVKPFLHEPGSVVNGGASALQVWLSLVRLWPSSCDSRIVKISSYKDNSTLSWFAVSVLQAPAMDPLALVGLMASTLRRGSSSLTEICGVRVERHDQKDLSLFWVSEDAPVELAWPMTAHNATAIQELEIKYG